MRILTYLLVALSILCFGAMNYIEYAHLQLISGGLQSPDLRIAGYSQDQFTAWKEAIGPNGAALYLKAFPNGFDMIFPALFGATLALLIHQVLSRFPSYKRRGVLTKLLLPLVLIAPYVYFDYFENAVISDLLQPGIMSSNASVVLASALTVTKYAALAVALIVLLVFWLAGLKHRKTSQQA